jgi:hypothetical protein
MFFWNIEFHMEFVDNVMLTQDKDLDFVFVWDGVK